MFVDGHGSMECLRIDAQYAVGGAEACIKLIKIENRA